ncbi:AAA family ATPase [Embleya sp. NPDC005575]|uniref:AAA family ATPase n=1 Tax=Embleya sp. NPDC005575 TaxID=3156892 RepID=UPI0033BAB8FE
MTEASEEPPHANVSDGGAGDTYAIDIGGNAAGPVIAGHHIVVVDAEQHSTVTLMVEGERPLPVRREWVALLPRRQRDPVGREADVARLAQAVRAGGLVQLWGPPGVGKSTLLRHAARILEPGPDGVVFLTAAYREVGDLAQEVFEACYDAVRYAPTSPELRRLMATVRVTVYIDDADLTAEQLRNLADAAPEATFVFAGQDRSLVGDGTALEVKGLDRAAGRVLLARELDGPLPTGEGSTADDLWQAARGRPRLLLRAAGLARPDASGRMTLPRPGAIADLLPLLFDQLDTAAMSALHLLATLGDAEVGATHIGALTDVPDPGALCDRLADLGLVEATENGYRCASDALPALRDRHARPFPVDTLCEYFAGWVALPSTTAAQVACHGRALEAVAELAEWAERPELAVRIARAASPALARSLRFGVWGRVLSHGSSAAEHANDANAKAYFKHEEGIRALLIGRRVASAVLLAEAVVLWRQLGDVHGADAAAHAQQYVPAASQAAAAPPPVTDGGATVTGVDPSVAPAATHGSTTAGVDPSATSSAAQHGHTAAGAHTTTGQSAAHGSGTTAGTHGTAAHGATGPGATGHGSTAHGTTTHGATAHGAPAHTTTAHASTAHGTHAPLAHGAGTHAGSGAAHTTGVAGAGGAHAGAAATVGAGAAASASGLTLALIAAAVVGAGVIGRVAYVQHERSSQSRDSTSVTADKTIPTRPAGLPGTWSNSPSEKRTPTSTPTGLAGTWREGQGNTFSIAESGYGGYTFQARNLCGDTESVRVTGYGSSYSGTRPLYDVTDSSCTSALGRVDITITVSSNGRNAQYTSSLPPGIQVQGRQVTCYGCGTQSWTRAS